MHLAALAILAAHALLWTVLNQFVSPHPDFVDHWVQSRIFSFGYFEHPPMVTWFIRVITALLGSTEAALETGAVVVNLAILAAAYGVAYSAFGAVAALFTLICLEATLYFLAGTPMLQIDQPLMLAWLAALACLLAYQRDRRARWLLLMGVFAGLGAMSKYVMIVFYMGVMAVITFVPSLRREWRNPWQYAGGLVALAIFSPVIVWNGLHEWVSFRFQLSKGGGAEGIVFGKHLVEFTVGYLLLFSPVLTVGGVVIALRRLPRMIAPGDGWWSKTARGDWRERPETLLAVMAVVPVAFFSLVMLRGSFPDPKWANLGFLAFYLLVGKLLADRWKEGLRRSTLWLLGGSYALTVALFVAIALHGYRPYLPLAPNADPTRQVLGWREAAREVDQLLRRHQIPPPRYVVSFFYPLGAPFALHLPSQPLTYSFSREARNLWSDPRDMTPENTIMVCTGRNCRWTVKKLGLRTGMDFEPLGIIESSVGGIPRHRIRVYVPAREGRPNGKGSS